MKYACLTDLDKQLSAPMTQKLVKSNLHFERRALPFDKQILEKTEESGECIITQVCEWKTEMVFKRIRKMCKIPCPPPPGRSVFLFALHRLQPARYQATRF